MHYWEIWYPRGAATGILVSRGRVQPTERMFFHAASDPIAVEVYDDTRKLVARGLNLGATDDTPMCLLTLRGKAVVREDIWPGEEHLGTPVLLPGGEAGILKSWWNAADHSEWRWQVEFYNSRG